MSADDREARRLAVEAAARATIDADNLNGSGISGRALCEAFEALRAAVRRLDAPRYEIHTCTDPGNFAISMRAGVGNRSIVAHCERYQDAEKIVALLNDAEGR